MSIASKVVVQLHNAKLPMLLTANGANNPMHLTPNLSKSRRG